MQPTQWKLLAVSIFLLAPMSHAQTAEPVTGAAAVVSTTVPATDATTSPTDTQIANFAKVDEGIFRGGNPGLAGLIYLKKIGIKTIINLQGGDRSSSVATKSIFGTVAHAVADTATNSVVRLVDR